MPVDDLCLAALEVLPARAQIHLMDCSIDDALVSNFRSLRMKPGETLDVLLLGGAPLLHVVEVT